MFKCFFGSVPKCSESFRLRPNIMVNVRLNIIPCYEIRKWYWFLVREAEAAFGNLPRQRNNLDFEPKTETCVLVKCSFS